MKLKHKVFVVIPMYNAINTILRCVDSAYNQMNVDIEIIIVDHGSIDGSYELVKKTYSSIETIHILHIDRFKEEHSATRPLNVGFKYSMQLVKSFVGTGWTIRLDSDDYFCTNSIIEEMLNLYENNVKIINGKILMFDCIKKSAHSYSTKTQYSSKDMLMHGAAYAFSHHATLIRIDLIKYVFNCDGFFFYTKVGYGEDLDFTIRLIRQCRDENIRFINKCVVCKKLDGKTISNTYSYKNILKDHLIIFSRNREMSVILLLRIIIWFALEKSKIKTNFAPPAYRFAEIVPLSYESIECVERM